MTLALIHAIIAAATEIRFDQAAPPEARLVLNDTWSGSIRMSAEEFRLLAREGVASRFKAMAQIAGILAVSVPSRALTTAR